MKTKELRQKSKTELQRILMESRDKLLQFRFDLANKKLKNTKLIKETKKDIARILTLNITQINADENPSTKAKLSTGQSTDKRR